MVKAIILFRQMGKRTPVFDAQYNDFLMKMEALPGLRRKSVSTVYAAPGGIISFSAVVEVTFEDHAALEAALTSPPGVEAGQTLKSLAGPDAIILYADVLEESY